MGSVSECMGIIYSVRPYAYETYTIYTCMLHILQVTYLQPVSLLQLLLSNAHSFIDATYKELYIGTFMSVGGERLI